MATKIALPAILVTLCLLVVSGVAWTANSGMSYELHNVADKGMVNIEEARLLDSALQELQLGATQVVAALALQQNAVVIDSMKARLGGKLTEFERTITDANTLAAKGGDSVEATERADDLKTIVEAVNDYRAGYDRVFSVPAGDIAAAANALVMLNDAHRIAVDKVSILLSREASAAQQSLKQRRCPGNAQYAIDPGRQRIFSHLGNLGRLRQYRYLPLFTPSRWNDCRSLGARRCPVEHRC
ncbi:hypothetical protein [Rhodoferax sp.]|uniref:hypothetical protein n=1 Tax=Rhodoferax sp. TaxID=50421 RepID=UPI002ACD38FE|nr:hypothetical protein [Rhodoferax sp.]MDZ7919487.1 hypothetical protein [Rhodoferax sp.]